MLDKVLSASFAKKVVATAIITSAVSGLIPLNIAGVSNAQPANAYQSWEHPFHNYTGYLNSERSSGFKTQEGANKYCSDYFNLLKYLGKGFVWIPDKGRYWLFAPWQRPYVWANQNSKECIVNF